MVDRVLAAVAMIPCLTMERNNSLCVYTQGDESGRCVYLYGSSQRLPQSNLAMALVPYIVLYMWIDLCHYNHIYVYRILYRRVNVRSNKDVVRRVLYYSFRGIYMIKKD